MASRYAIAIVKYCKCRLDYQVCFVSRSLFLNRRGRRSDDRRYCCAFACYVLVPVCRSLCMIAKGESGLRRILAMLLWLDRLSPDFLPSWWRI